MAKTTSEITNKTTEDIKLWLYRQGIFSWRQNVVGIVSRGVMRSAPKKGVSDILAACPPLGRILCVEIKTGNDKMSEDQEGFRANIEHVGGWFIEAHTLEDFIEKFEKLKV